MDIYLPKMSTLDAEKLSRGDSFKILVATDCHLGYEETDLVIGEDTFITFEEVLTKAVDEEVDMVLLGGDLFHHNNPSQRTMNKCLELLRQYTLGSQNVQLELLSRASESFSHCITQTANFLDENINVSIPVFSIHGNHDDPSGIGQQSSMDTLSSAGLVNYFGKCTDLTEITVKPIVMKKKNTYLALYGLGHIKDDRLCRLFISNNVTFLEPEVSPEKCFRILVLHQNRAERGPKRFVSESFIPSFFDFVIWGHEHDCRITPEWNIEKEFMVVQPGSTVATSLCEGEALPKHIGILRLWEDYFNFEPIKLNTVRPFVWKSISLSEFAATSNEPKLKSEELKEYCRTQIEEMIREARALVTGHPKQPKLPLIRLRCEYTDDTELFNSVKFGQQFLNRVATPNLEIIRFKKVATARNAGVESDRGEVIRDLRALYGDGLRESQKFSECVNDIVSDYFQKHAEASLAVLNVKEMEEAVEKFLDKGETDVINLMIDRKVKNLVARLISYGCDDEEVIEQELEKLKEEGAPKEMVDDVAEKSAPGVVEESDSGTDEYEPDVQAGPPSLKKIQLAGGVRNRTATSAWPAQDEPTGSSGKGRGSSRGRGRGRGRKVAEVNSTKTAASSRNPHQTKLSFPVTSSIVYDDDDSD